MVRIYQIKKENITFKQNIIRATNYQNAIKTASLYANDPIQIEIQNILKKLGYLYDRKGESKQEESKNVISMVQAALAYRAVFEYGAQKLRAKIGQSRAFQKDEYERIYKEDYLEKNGELYELSVKLLTSTLIMDVIRDGINKNALKYIERLPIIKKSTYYLSGLFYAMNKKMCDNFIQDCAKLLKEDNSIKAKNSPIFDKFLKFIHSSFSKLVAKYHKFYDEISIDKTDIDNMLKSKEFGNEFEKLIESMSAKEQG